MLICEVNIMLKKYLLLLVMIFLCGCEASTPETKETPKDKPKEIEQISYHNLWNGDGNEHGFYHKRMREVKGETIINIYYYDYETKQEIFLCDRPECEHIDDSCTSYLNGAEYVSSELFVQNDHIYLLTSDLASLDQKARRGAQLVQLDLDGKNKIVLATLPEGYTFSDNGICFSNTFAFIPMAKTEDVMVNENTYMQVEQKNTLFRVNLHDGDVEEIMEINGLRIISGDAQNIIFAKYQYEQDPMELLQSQQYEAYDQVMLNAKLMYTTYNVNTKAFVKDIPSISNTIGVYLNQHMYELQGSTITAISLQSGESKTVATLPDDQDVTITEAIDDHLILDAFDQSLDTEGIAAAYTFDVNTQEVKSFPLLTKNPKQHATIYGATKNQYFVYYDHEQHLETSWAGTDQYVNDHISMGLIPKEDYWNGVGNFIPFETITVR